MTDKVIDFTMASIKRKHPATVDMEAVQRGFRDIRDSRVNAALNLCPPDYEGIAARQLEERNQRMTKDLNVQRNEFAARQEAAREERQDVFRQWDAYLAEIDAALVQAGRQADADLIKREVVSKWYRFKERLQNV